MFGNVWEWIRGESGKFTVIGGDVDSFQRDFDLGRRVNYLNSPGHYMIKGLRLGRGPVAAADEFTEVKPNVAEEKAETERKAVTQKTDAEADRKAMEEAAKDIIKLAAVMAPIPGKNCSMCKFEVTQALWSAVMGKNPSEFKGADLPVENVSWNDCQKFLEKLNALPEVRASGHKYRLPTEDEWQYACRAETTGNYCKLTDGTEITSSTLDAVAWFADNAHFETHPVGQKKPNAFGLYDMYGNVCEWTAKADDRLFFYGGSWRESAAGCRVDRPRGSPNPDYRNSIIGFRLVW